MGKMGVSFAIGGSIAAVIMVIGMITLAADTATPTTSTLGLHGHYSITITDSEGNLKAYLQTDNEPTHLLKDCLFDGYFGTTVAQATCSITTAEIAVGDAGEIAPIDTDTDLGNRYTNSGNGTAVIGTGGDVPTSSSSTETTVTYENTASVITISQTDLDASPTGSNADGTCIQVSGGSGVDCFLDEVGLFDAAGLLLSHATFTKTEVSVGDQVDVKLKITLT